MQLRDQLHGRRGGACCRPDLSIGGCFGQVAVEGHGADGHPAAGVVVPDALAGQEPAGRVQKLLLSPALELRWADEAGEGGCRHEHVNLPSSALASVLSLQAV